MFEAGGMPIDLTPMLVTLRLAFVTTLALMLVATPLAFALAHARGRWKVWAEAATAMPLVLPPTVLGFYLLTLFSPESWFGGLWLRVTGETLVFSFTGLVLASMIYSLPFAVQPLQAAFEAVGRAPLEAAATLNAGPWDRFFNVAAPLALRGFITAIVLTFAHTIGEFGVVLMVGGAIPGETKVISIAIYEHVELLDYAAAQWWSLRLVIFSFLVLLVVYATNRHLRPHII